MSNDFEGDWESTLTPDTPAGYRRRDGTIRIRQIPGAPDIFLVRHSKHRNKIFLGIKTSPTRITIIREEPAKKYALYTGEFYGDRSHIRGTYRIDNLPPGVAIVEAETGTWDAQKPPGPFEPGDEDEEKSRTK